MIANRNHPKSKWAPARWSQLLSVVPHPVSFASLVSSFYALFFIHIYFFTLFSSGPYSLFHSYLSVHLSHISVLIISSFHPLSISSISSCSFMLFFLSVYFLLFISLHPFPCVRQPFLLLVSFYHYHPSVCLALPLSFCSSSFLHFLLPLFYSLWMIQYNHGLLLHIVR